MLWGDRPPAEAPPIRTSSGGVDWEGREQRKAGTAGCERRQRPPPPSTCPLLPPKPSSDVPGMPERWPRGEGQPLPPSPGRMGEGPGGPGALSAEVRGHRSKHQNLLYVAKGHKTFPQELARRRPGIESRGVGCRVRADSSPHGRCAPTPHTLPAAAPCASQAARSVPASAENDHDQFPKEAPPQAPSWAPGSSPRHLLRKAAMAPFCRWGA